MKFKKVFIAIGLCTALVLGGCSQQKKTAAPVLTKNQVIKKTQQTFKSGQIVQSIRLSTDTSTQLVSANTSFGGEPTIFHINNQTTSKGKTQNTEEWVNSNNVYLNGRSTWYKTNFEKLSGHSYAELLDAVINNQTMMNPDKKLVDAFKMTRKKNTYTLTATIKDKSIMKDAADPIFSTTAQSAEQEKVFRRIQKYGKYQDMTVKAVVKNKMVSYSLFINMKLGKLMKVRLGQSYGNFGNYDFLKLPDSALNAKPLPKSSTKSK
ncbi:DUF6612 family protein [Lactobacillus sp. PSON]|uniref:DUF6612 family protein n=1 Tax=Lactobacillus sp. PSON TaxID=3455454 RepID=UPI0040435D92